MMKSITLLMAVALLTAGCTGVATNPTRLVQINSADYGDTKCMMRVVELERNANTSKFRFTYEKRASSVGSSMFVMRAFYEVAKARGTEYFTNLKEWDDADGGRIYIGGFTNKKDANIQDEFGDEFTLTNKHGQTRRCMSVSQCDMLWGNERKRRVLNR